MKIYFETSGQGEDIVLLHGWTQTHKIMSPIVNFLKDKYRVTNFDLPGMGGSDWDESIQTIHDIADRILPHLPASARIIGWSFGGLVAKSIASRYPERVKQFIGVAATPKFIESSDWPGFPAPGFAEVFKDMPKIGLKNLLRDCYYDEFSQAVGTRNEKIDTLMSYAEDYDLDILFRGYHICDAADLRDEFSSISCPMDLIFGEKDAAVPLEAHGNIQSLNGNTNIHVIKEGKHLPFWTHEDEFNNLLHKVLEVA